MDTPQNSESTATYILRLLDAGESQDFIEKSLIERGNDIGFVKELMKSTVQLRHERKRTKGLALILVGAIFCILSFLLTILGIFPDDQFGMVLFGLTGIGVTIVFTGFTMIF